MLKLVVVIGFIGAGLVGCGESSEQSAAPSTPAGSWKLASMPEGAVGIGAVKASAGEGDTVVMRGTIGGRVEPISDGVAVFLMVDNDVTSCADLGEDHCATPWDYCCEPEDSLRANNATVQLIGEEGGILTLDLREHGFEPMADVIVVGTVEPRPSQDVLIIKATGIYRVDG